ncbi:MAG TPA: DUF5985 family protein [Nitrospira sp.]|nr:DUF5985 family protein [Nitrospira sp.]
MIQGLVYALCMLTALMCAWLLLQAYQRTHYRLLFWCSIYFSIAAMNNVFLVVDKVIYPDVDLTVYRYMVALAGLLVLLPGLILERE